MNSKKLIVCASFIFIWVLSVTAMAPASADQLLKEVQSAIKTKNTNALLSLVNWQGVNSKNKALASSVLSDVFDHEIESVSLIPLSGNCPITNEVNGIRYRPNVPPIGMIAVKYVKTANSWSETQLPYGQDKNGFWIPGTIEEKFSGSSMAELAAKAKADAAKASFKAHPELLSQKNEYGQTPLIVAAKNGEAEMVEMLLSFNVDIYAKDNGGNTAIHWAAGGNHAKVINRLLAKKCDVNARNAAGWTPLHSAIAFAGDNTNAAAALLAHHADVNARADDGTTPLHWAALYGYKSVAALLIANKADVNIKDDAGQTPLDKAADTNSMREDMKLIGIPGKQVIIDLLKQAGAKS